MELSYGDDNKKSIKYLLKLGAAFAAGCTVVIKPAIETPLSALALGELCLRAGFPEGSINILTTSNASEFGKEMCKNPKIAKISFTGSTKVGSILMRDCSEGIKNVSLELGGNAAFIVFDDADISKAAEGVMMSKFRNAGQTCVAPNRFYVHEKVYEKFIKILQQKVVALRMGNSFSEENIDVGSLINTKAVQKVERLVSDAIKRGAKVICGGMAHEDVYFQPTLLSNVADDSLMLHEEIFGPIIPVVKFSDEREVLEKANNTVYGLVHYFYSNDVNRVSRVAAKLQAGMIAINSPSVSVSCGPFGGIKQSGVGREGGKHGIREYTEIKFCALGLL